METTVFVLDDDDKVRQSLVRLLRSDGYPVRDFASAEDFLREPLPVVPSCLVLDMRLASGNGLDVLEALSRQGAMLPVIFITAFGSIPLTVRAMKAGAQEFLTKPVAADELLAAVRSALQVSEANLRAQRDRIESVQRYAKLTAREREVLSLAVGGLMNKQIASELGIQEVTAKVHKQKVMEKMGAKGLAELIRAADRLNIDARRTHASAARAPEMNAD